MSYVVCLTSYHPTCIKASSSPLLSIYSKISGFQTWCILNGISCIICNVWSILYCVFYIVHFVLYILYGTFCIVYFVWSILYGIFYMIYCISYVVYDILYILCCIWYIVYDVLYMVYSMGHIVYDLLYWTSKYVCGHSIDHCDVVKNIFTNAWCKIQRQRTSNCLYYIGQ